MRHFKKRRRNSVFAIKRDDDEDGVEEHLLEIT